MTRPHPVSRVVGVSGNLGIPSRTKSLVEEVMDLVGREAGTLESLLIDLSEFIRPAISRGTEGMVAGLQGAADVVETAEYLVVGTPVYRGSYTGILKCLFDFVERDGLLNTSVVLTATAASDHHFLVIEHQLRPLFGFFRAFTAPTGVYATEAAFSEYRLISGYVRDLAHRAAREAVAWSQARRSLLDT